MHRSIQELLRERHRLHKDEFNRHLRRLVVTEGLPEEPFVNHVQIEEEGPQAIPHTLRGVVWKTLLRVRHVSVREYAELVSRGPSEHAEDIDKDVHRTFRDNATFRERVPPEVLTRVLNALSHALREVKRPEGGTATNGTEDSHSRVGFSQGFNLIAGVFLVVLSEVEAFWSMLHLLTEHMPRWLVKSNPGARDGCGWVEQLVRAADPTLDAHLRAHHSGSYGRIVPFSRIVSLFACMRPLRAVLQLWDAIFAVGPCMTIFLAAAELLYHRDMLLASERLPLQRLLPISAGLIEPSPLRSIAFSLLEQVPRRWLRALHTFPKQPCPPESVLTPPPGAEAGADADSVSHASVSASATASSSAASPETSPAVASPRRNPGHTSVAPSGGTNRVLRRPRSQRRMVASKQRPAHRTISAHRRRKPATPKDTQWEPPTWDVVDRHPRQPRNAGPKSPAAKRLERSIAAHLAVDAEAISREFSHRTRRHHHHHHHHHHHQQQQEGQVLRGRGGAVAGGGRLRGDVRPDPSPVVVAPRSKRRGGSQGPVRRRTLRSRSRGPGRNGQLG